MKTNLILEYFCQELPDRWNLLSHESYLLQGGGVFAVPSGLRYQVAVFRFVEEGVEMEHIMVFTLN